MGEPNPIFPVFILNSYAIAISFERIWRYIGGDSMTPKKKLTDLQEESGQALVEFALVLMFVILPFTFVLVDGAMLLFSQAALTNAAR